MSKHTYIYIYIHTYIWQIQNDIFYLRFGKRMSRFAIHFVSPSSFIAHLIDRDMNFAIMNPTKGT